ncbi:zf-TFIIB domain-containing protein [Blastococcus sp. SYSU D00922]
MRTPGRELATPEVRCAGMELTCPKCHGTMRTYERNGVHVDQCTDCRGIFLDRGELDRLIDAENSWHGGHADQARRPEEHRSSGHPQGAAASAGLGGVVGEVLRQVQGTKHSSHSSTHRRKKESFLGDLFG